MKTTRREFIHASAALTLAAAQPVHGAPRRYVVREGIRSLSYLLDAPVQFEQLQSCFALICTNTSTSTAWKRWLRRLRFAQHSTPRSPITEPLTMGCRMNLPDHLRHKACGIGPAMQGGGVAG